MTTAEAAIKASFPSVRSSCNAALTPDQRSTLDGQPRTRMPLMGRTEGKNGQASAAMSRSALSNASDGWPPEIR